MATQTQTSGFLSLDLKDAVKGLVTAVITAVLTGVYNALTTTPVSLNWKEIITVGVTAGIGYLLKNLFTPSQIVVKGTNDDSGLNSGDTPPVPPTKP